MVRHDARRESFRCWRPDRRLSISAARNFAFGSAPIDRVRGPRQVNVTQICLSIFNTSNQALDLFSRYRSDSKSTLDVPYGEIVEIRL